MGFYCEIGDVDYGPGGLAALQTLRLTPGTHGEIGGALLVLQQTAGAFDIVDKQQVFVYEADEAGNITQRLFAGFVSRVKTTIIKGTHERVLLVQCQDWNLLLDRIVGRAATAHAINVAAGTFDDQIASVVAAVQSGAASGIDAVSGVANLTGATVLPGQVFRGMSLREMLGEVCAAARRADGALQPRFYLGYDTAMTTLFGAPVLQVYDYAVAGAVANWSFSDDPGIGEWPILGTFVRDLDGSDLVNYQQTFLVNNGLVSTGAVAGSQADHPNPYSGQNAWAAPPVADSWSTDSTQAQAFATSLVAESAYSYETVQFATDQKVRPGQFVDVTMADEGLLAQRYAVLATDWDFTIPGLPLATLTLGERATEAGVAHQTTLADLQAAPVFEIRRFGAMADGVTDDAAAINSAVAAAAWAGGGIVDLGPGPIRANAPIVLAHGVHLRGCGPESTVLDFAGMSGGVAADPCVTAAGTLGATIGTLASAVAEHSNSLVFTTDVELQAGDVLLLHDATPGSFNAARTYYTAGEYVRVLSYDAGTKTATLATRTHAGYAATISVYKPTLVTTSVKGLTLRYKYGYRGIMLQLGHGCSFRDLAMSGSEYSLLELDRSFECDVTSVVGIDTNSGSGSYRYGLSVVNSQRVHVAACTFDTGRHGLVTGGSTSAGAIPVRELVVTGSTIGGGKSTTAGNGINGFDLHGNSEHIVLADCNLPNGATLAGDHVVMSGCTVRNGAGGVLYLTETLGFNFHISDCQFHISHDHPDNFAFLYAQFKSDFTARSGGQFRFVDNWVDFGASVCEDSGQSTIGLYLYNVSGPADNSVVVEGNTFQSALTSHTAGVFGATIRAFAGTGLREVIVRNNTLRGCGLRVEQTGSRYVCLEGNYVYGALDRGIMLQKPSATPAYGAGVVVCRNNTVIGAKYNGIQLEGNSAGDTIMFAHHNLSINNNKSAATGAIALETSIYVHNAERVIFEHNVCGDNQATPTQHAWWCADNIVNLYDSETHNVGSVTTIGLTSITNRYTGIGALPGTITAGQHGSLGGGSLHAAATTSANGFMVAADKVKIDQFSPAASKVLTVAKALTLDASADGYILTVPATGTAALRDVTNTFTSQQIFNTAGGALRLRDAAGTNRDLIFDSGTLARWIVRTTSTTESGGNAGSNLQIMSRTDAGGALATVLDLNRANGAITTSGALTVGGALAASNFAGAFAASGFTLTVPATGTAALLATANAFTALQTVGVSSTDVVAGAAATNVTHVIGQTANMTGTRYAGFFQAQTDTGAFSSQTTMGFRAIAQFRGTAVGAQASSIYGANLDANTAAASTGNLALAQGLSTSFTHNGSGTVADAYAAQYSVTAGVSGGPVTNAYVAYLQLANNGANTIVSGYALRIVAPGGSGAITTNYAIRVANQGRAAIGTAYGLYMDSQSGAGANYAIYTNDGAIRLGDHVTLADGKNIATGTATGMQIGTATNQKLGFFAKTPIVQPTGGAGTAAASYGTTEQGMLQRAYDALRNLGLMS